MTIPVSSLPKRVLHIVGRMDRAGAETMVMNLYREIDRSRFQFDFVYFTVDRCDYDDEIELLGGRVHRVSADNQVARFQSLYRLLRSGAWTIVHSHTLFSSGLHLAAARLARIPIRVAHSHSTQDANSASLVGRAYQYSARRLLGWAGTRFVACGVAAAEYLFPGRADVVVIPNAVDIGRFAGAPSTAARATLGIPEGQFVIMQIGRLIPIKNHVRSLRIAEALVKSGVDFQLLLVGAGPEQDCIEARVRELHLELHVRLLGLRTDIPELMAAADVMLMPSLHEGFPVVLVEAQAAGLPSVVSSAISGEVELGMGMVQFVELDASDSEWGDALQAAARYQVPGARARQCTLEQAGFSAAAGAHQLQQLYDAP